MKDLKQFIGKYPVSKTLRFELRPVGRTQEWIEKNGVVENDEHKAENYPQVKKLIDEYPVRVWCRSELGCKTILNFYYCRSSGHIEQRFLGCKTILNFYYCSQSMAWQKKIRRT